MDGHNRNLTSSGRSPDQAWLLICGSVNTQFLLLACDCRHGKVLEQLLTWDAWLLSCILLEGEASTLSFQSAGVSLRNCKTLKNPGKHLPRLEQPKEGNPCILIHNVLARLISKVLSCKKCKFWMQTLKARKIHPSWLASGLTSREGSIPATIHSSSLTNVGLDNGLWDTNTLTKLIPVEEGRLNAAEA